MSPFANIFESFQVKTTPASLRAWLGKTPQENLELVSFRRLGWQPVEEGGFLMQQVVRFEKNAPALPEHINPPLRDLLGDRGPVFYVEGADNQWNPIERQLLGCVTREKMTGVHLTEEDAKAEDWVVSFTEFNNYLNKAAVAQLTRDRLELISVDLPV